MSFVSPPLFIHVLGVEPEGLLGGLPSDEEAALDCETWFSRQSLPHRERKLADRQAILFFRLLSQLKGFFHEERAKALPVFAAVGPAQTDVLGMREWATRVSPGSPMPMISPAAAISLLPNSPFTWTANRLGLRGESSVWSGFEEAGHAALFAATLFSLETHAPSLMMAVTCPHNYFVENTRHRASLDALPSAVEGGVCLHLSCSPVPESRRIGSIEIFPPQISPAHIRNLWRERFAATLEERDFPCLISEAADEMDDSSQKWGRLACAALPAAMAWACSDAMPRSRPVGLMVRDSWGFWRTALLLPLPTMEGEKSP
jgi:hypothetical protein